jgi:hypothetical protein
MPAHRKGETVAKTYSIRLEPSVREELAKRHGTLQGAIDNFIDIDEHKINFLAAEHANKNSDPEAPEWDIYYRAFVSGYIAAKR